MMLFTLRNALIVAALGLAAAFGYETDWGDAFTAQPLTLRNGPAKHDSAAVLPDFRLSSEANAYAQIAERPLLNPSRKPAPTQAPVAAATEPPKPQIRRGLYTLVGVTDLGSVKIAQLKEVSTGRIKSVKVGDDLQEMKLAKIDGDRVTLSFMGETDVFDMAKFTASGRAPQPLIVAPTASPAPVTTPTPLPVPVPPLASVPAANNDDAAATALLEARRAARAAPGDATSLPGAAPQTPRLTAFDRERILRERRQQ